MITIMMGLEIILKNLFQESKKGRVIFIDVDETLLDYENKLPALADRAIKEAIKKEHCVYIYTGRSEAEVYDYIWNIGLDEMMGVI